MCCAVSAVHHTLCLLLCLLLFLTPSGADVTDAGNVLVEDVEQDGDRQSALPCFTCNSEGDDRQDARHACDDPYRGSGMDDWAVTDTVHNLGGCALCTKRKAEHDDGEQTVIRGCMTHTELSAPGAVRPATGCEESSELGEVSGVVCYCGTALCNGGSGAGTEWSAAATIIIIHIYYMMDRI